MNARKLQTAVVEDLTKLFQDRRYKVPGDLKDGKHETAPVKFYKQNLPRLRNQDELEPFPHGIVRIDSGNIETRADAHKVAVIILIGAFDDDMENQGHDAVLEILELIQEHYEENPLLKKCFKYIPPFNWALQDEESFPYFYGAAQLTFELPRPSPKWSELV